MPQLYPLNNSSAPSPVNATFIFLFFIFLDNWCKANKWGLKTGKSKFLDKPYEDEEKTEVDTEGFMYWCQLTFHKELIDVLKDWRFKPEYKNNLVTIKDDSETSIENRFLQVVDIVERVGLREPFRSQLIALK